MKGKSFPPAPKKLLYKHPDHIGVQTWSKSKRMKKNSVDSQIWKTLPEGQSIRFLTQNKAAYLKIGCGKKNLLLQSQFIMKKS